MKKTFRLLFVFFLVALLSACSSADYSNQTIVGKISKIEGNTITLELGDVLENEQDEKILQFDGEAPQMSENGTGPQMNGERPSFNGEVPELPENGEMPQFDGEAPQMPGNGNPPEMNGEKPELPDNTMAPTQGEMPQFNGEAPQFSENGELPEIDGEAPQMLGNGTPPEMNGESPQFAQNSDALQSQMTYTFTSSGKVLEIDLENIGITLDELMAEFNVKVGDVIGVSFGSNNSIESIRFYDISE